MRLALASLYRSPSGSAPVAAKHGLAVIARENLPLILLTLGYLGTGIVVQMATGAAILRALGWTTLFSGIGLAFFLTAMAAVSLILVFLLTRLLGNGSAWAEYRRNLTLPSLGGIFIVFVALAVLMAVFVGFKRAIPVFQPFAWDPALLQLDRVIHLGHDPWKLLQPVFGYPSVTAALDYLYYLWFPLKIVVLLLMAWSPNRQLRGQFLLTYFSLWIVLGTVVATAFSSAGPVYYGRVTGLTDPFVPLMEYLHRVDATHSLRALDIQAHLWNGYSTKAMHVIEGIAAMPSLHVALPVLYSMAAWKLHRVLGIVFGAYALVIFLGSVHLGWHYAVDGYVTLVLVPIVWWLCGKLVRRNLDAGGLSGPLPARNFTPEAHPEPIETQRTR